MPVDSIPKNGYQKKADKVAFLIALLSFIVSANKFYEMRGGIFSDVYSWILISILGAGVVAIAVGAVTTIILYGLEKVNGCKDEIDRKALKPTIYIALLGFILSLVIFYKIQGIFSGGFYILGAFIVAVAAGTVTNGILYYMAWKKINRTSEEACALKSA